MTRLLDSPSVPCLALALRRSFQSQGLQLWRATFCQESLLRVTGMWPQPQCWSPLSGSAGAGIVQAVCVFLGYCKTGQ